MTVISALLVVGSLALASALLMGYAAARFQRERLSLVDKIDALLPQTQCGQCSYPGCRPYAEAIARGDADINQCPPGGALTIGALAELLGRDAKPLDPGRGTSKLKQVAFIDEALCIGCFKCILACPVDAILGAPKQMHTVVSSECTGCELCVEPCPVDCIDMRVVDQGMSNWRWPRPQDAPRMGL
ncbi:MAG: electron transport complex subunit RsxB [Gammaproteobacteria bacterium]|nr:electron transport complex subunit RsxB [Gammaproteobacteria bacterium]MCI0590845.1 electron transport complex subunit RsxB [Gammaproteobacteria bacterium]